MPYLPTTTNAVPKELFDPSDTSGEQVLVRPPSALKQGAAVLSDQEFHSVHMSIATAASMGFGTSDLAGSHDRRFSLIEWRRYMEKPRKDGVIEYWGVSIRYSVEYRSSDLNGDFSITGLAASAEISNSSVQIDFSTRGINSDKLATPIPIRTKLNVETYAEMVGAMNRIREEVQATPKDLIKPRLIGVTTRPDLVIEGMDDPDLDRAVSITYALTGLAQGVDYREVRQSWKGADDQMPIIESVYEAFGAASGDIPEHVKRRAKDEVANYRLARTSWGPLMRKAT